MTLSGLRVAARIARRDALRARGRSALVVAMIALPVLGATVVDVVVRTVQLDPPDIVERQLGAAQARVEQTGFGAVDQAPAGAYDVSTRRFVRARLPDLLPAGSRILADAFDRTVVRTDDGLARAAVREFDYADPAARGLVRQVEGSAPRGRGEVALSPDLARRTGLEVGGTLITRDPPRELRVVGIAEDPTTSDEGTAFALPGTVLGTAGATDSATDSRSRSLLVASPEPISWEQVKRINRSGFVVLSRAVLLDPPPPEAVDYLEPGSGDGELFAGGALAVGLVLLEVVLLAGPPFAVAVRRRQRDLALIAATGAGRGDVRAVVLAEGLVLGAAAGVGGVLLGIATAAVAKPWFAELAGEPLGRLDVRPPELAAVALVGVLAAVLAALLPARTAARQDVVTALAGRRPVAPARRRTSLLGVVAAAAGAAIAAVGAGANDQLLVLAGAVLAELGVLLLLPMLVAGAGRLARFLPVAPRLALRDAARNRARTVPAIAAITAAVAGCVAATVIVSTQAAKDRASYAPTAREGQVVLDLGRLPRGTSREQVASVVARELPVRGGPVLRSQSVLIDTERMPTEAEEESATAGLAGIAPNASLYVERGFVNDYDVGLLALFIVAAAVTLAAAAIATGLAGAEAMPDLATLAAVGASPRTRRLLSASRSLVIAGLGTVTGVAAGLVPGVAYVKSTAVANGESAPLTIPWPQLALAALALPLLAALLTGAVTRSRIALIRRIA